MLIGNSRSTLNGTSFLLFKKLLFCEKECLRQRITANIFNIKEYILCLCLSFRSLPWWSWNALCRFFVRNSKWTAAGENCRQNKFLSTQNSYKKSHSYEGKPMEWSTSFRDTVESRFPFATSVLSGGCFYSPPWLQARNNTLNCAYSIKPVQHGLKQERKEEKEWFWKTIRISELLLFALYLSPSLSSSSCKLRSFKYYENIFLL